MAALGHRNRAACRGSGPLIGGDSLMTFPSPGADWPRIDAYLKGLGIRIDNPTFGETEGGNHVAGSEHYLHRARDYPVSSCDAPAVARALQPLAHGPGFIID